MTNLTIDILAATPVAAIPPVIGVPGVDFDAILSTVVAPAETIGTPASDAAALPVGRQILAGAGLAVAAARPAPVDLPPATAPNFWIALEVASPEAGSAKPTLPSPVSDRPVVAPDVRAKAARVPGAEPQSGVGPRLACVTVPAAKFAYKPAASLLETTALNPPVIKPAEPDPPEISDSTPAPTAPFLVQIAPKPAPTQDVQAVVDPISSPAVAPPTPSIYTEDRPADQVIAEAPIAERKELPADIVETSVPVAAESQPTLDPAAAVAGATPILVAPLPIAPEQTKPPTANPRTRRVAEPSRAAPAESRSAVPTAVVFEAPIRATHDKRATPEPVLPVSPVVIAPPTVTVQPASPDWEVAPTVAKAIAVDAVAAPLPRAAVVADSVTAVATAAVQTVATAAVQISAPAPANAAPIEMAFQPVADTRPAVTVAAPPVMVVPAPAQPAAAAPIQPVPVQFQPPPTLVPVVLPPVRVSAAPAAGNTAASDLTDDGADIVSAAPPAQTIASITPRTVAMPAATPTVDTSRIDWIEALIDRIDDNRGLSGHRSTHIRLLPDALGGVDVRIRHDGDRVTVNVTADNPQARAMLAEAAPRLVELAESRGLKLGDSGVDQGRGGQRSADQQHQSAQHQSAQHQPAQPRAPRPAATESADEAGAADRLA